MINYIIRVGLSQLGEVIESLANITGFHTLTVNSVDGYIDMDVNVWFKKGVDVDYHVGVICDDYVDCEMIFRKE